jgi:hypothetical protein
LAFQSNRRADHPNGSINRGHSTRDSRLRVWTAFFVGRDERHAPIDLLRLPAPTDQRSHLPRSVRRAGSDCPSADLPTLKPPANTLWPAPIRQAAPSARKQAVAHGATQDRFGCRHYSQLARPRSPPSIAKRHPRLVSSDDERSASPPTQRSSAAKDRSSEAVSRIAVCRY